ncbi:MAG: hypothetical protein WBM24_11355 [Candidatus Sulfotelmatobacter sp.]
MQNEVKNMGFHRTELLQGKELNGRDFKDRTDELLVRGSRGNLKVAWV